jgi:nucleotide-binding universal stress UspA family protein
MKHILVGIDFSKSADRALAYAEEIALVFSSTISLVYIHSPSSGNPAEAAIDLQLYAEASERLAELGASVSDRGISTVVSAHRGEIVPSLKKIIAEGDCDLIVMGCQGENFIPDKPWGSTTTAVMEDIRIPLLAVPGYAPVKYPRRFLLSTDQECPDTLRQLSPMLRLLEAERTELLLFHYQQATERAMPDREYARLLRGIKHRFYYQADNHQPIEHAVTGFAELTATNLLVVTHREDHWFGAKQTDSVASSVSWTSSIPVLILQDSF